MKIGILKHTNTVFTSPIKYRYTISDGEEAIDIFSADDYEVGITVPEITDGAINKTYEGEWKILKKWELYEEVDLDGIINFELLEKSMNRLPITADFFVDMIKAIRELRDTQKEILRFVKWKYQHIKK